MGYPGVSPLPGTGVPPAWTGVPQPGAWVPSPRKDMGPVEVIQDGDGVPQRKDMGPVEILCDEDGVSPPPPPPPIQEWTEKQGDIAFPILRMRPVKECEHKCKIGLESSL